MILNLTSRLLLSFTAALSLASAPELLAQTKQTDSPTNTPPAVQLPSSTPTKQSDLPTWAVSAITPVHTVISSWVDNSSRHIDGFFGSDDFLDVDNHSYLRLTEELQWLESEGNSNQLGARFKLHVPTTEKRLKLVFENSPEESDPNLDDGSRESDDTEGAVLGLEGSRKDEPHRAWKHRLNAGVRLRFPLDPYLRFTSDRLWAIKNSPWTMEVKNRVSWFENNGYSARNRWDIGRSLGKSTNFRALTTLQWRETQDTLEFSERLEVNRVLDKRSVLRYALVAVGEGATQPEVNDYYTQLYFRRDIHEQFLFFDLIPEWHWARENNFKPRWEITLRLELYFRGDITLR